MKNNVQVMRTFMLLLLLIFNSVFIVAQEISTSVAYHSNKYSAFTSLEYRNNYFYCAFREGDTHVSTKGDDNGVVKILTSKDGEKWNEVLLYALTGIDLRDPKLSLAPDGRIMLLVEGVKYNEGKPINRNSFVSFIDVNNKITKLKAIEFTPNMSYNWLWDGHWVENSFYGFTYIPKFCFIKSADGINYSLIDTLPLSESPSEASLAQYSKNKLICVVRTVNNALIGISDKRKNCWKWYDSGYKIGGPDIANVNGDIFVAGRSYDNNGKRTTLFKLDKKTFKLSRIMDISEDGDSSYPGLIYQDGILYISHYYVKNGVSSILFSKIKL